MIFCFDIDLSFCLDIDLLLIDFKWLLKNVHFFFVFNFFLYYLVLLLVVLMFCFSFAFFAGKFGVLK